jgi:hypothetical protein
VKDSGPSGCLRQVHATASTLPGPVSWKRPRLAPAPGEREDNAAPSRGAEADGTGRTAGRWKSPAADVSGKAKTARRRLISARRRASL